MFAAILRRPLAARRQARLHARLARHTRPARRRALLDHLSAWTMPAGWYIDPRD
jgi:hypothetical protein